VPLDRAWESCLTMGTQWHYKPTHETYRSGTELIEILIETRAKGGNLLLNVGPKPDGELAIEQEERLREIALWNFAFGESIDGVRPWVVSNEGNLWFTQRKNKGAKASGGPSTVYVFITKTPWVMGERKQFTVKSVKPTKDTQISVLGSDNKIIEYKPEVNAASLFRHDDRGLHLDVIMAQRLYNDRKWPNPLVLKLTNVEPAMTPPQVASGAGKRSGAEAVLSGELTSLGQAAAVEVGFEYRRRKQTEELLNADAPWKATPLAKRGAPGKFSSTISGLDTKERYEFRPVVKHPLVTVHGEEKIID
jgi:alpha-L-fucosidase